MCDDGPITMIRSNPPPVPPRPSKTVVAEALAKSRRVSPIRVLYATQPASPASPTSPTSPTNPTNPTNQKVVPVRSAPPPPTIKPKPSPQNIPQSIPQSISQSPPKPQSPKPTPKHFQSSITIPNSQKAQPQVPLIQVAKSYSTNTPPKLRPIEDPRIIRSVSDPKSNTRTLIYQSSNAKTDSPSIKELNELNSKTPENPIDKVIDVIVQSKDKTTIIVSKDDDNNNKKVQFDDKINHEILIAELQNMKEEQERFLKRQRKAPVELYDRIQHSDWIEVANGEEVRLSSCQIYIEDNSDDASPKLSKSSSFSSCSSSRRTQQAQRAPSMSSLHGLPPLPKSLSGFSLLDSAAPNRGGYRVSPGPQTPSRAGSSRGTTPPTPGSGSGSGHVVYPPHPAPNQRVNGTSEISGTRGRKLTTLDTQLAVLRREMYGLRQLDLSLLSQLYSLNEAIQDFRQILQDQEDSALSPNSPSPSPSSGDEGDEFYSPAPLRYKPAPPAPPLRRTSNSSSANSSEYGTV